MGALCGQVGVVTGASGGVGQAIALGLAVEGVTLCLVGRKLETLRAVLDSARSVGGRAVGYRADLTLDEDVKELGRRLEEDYDGVDLLIHSAGVIALGPLGTAGLDDFDRQYRTNVRAPYAVTQALLPMLRARRGQIVFINSSAGLKARANVSQYAATKHALKALADSLRDEVNRDGVRVLSVFLGRSATPMQVAVHAMEGRAYRPDRLIQPPDVASVVINTLRLPRSAEVTDISIRPLVKTD